MTPSLLADVALPLAIAIIMAGLGASLTVADFRRIAAAPRGILVGLVNLALVAPVLAILIADLFDLRPAFAVGLVLLGASPGGMMAGMLTQLARGDTALSVTMTALSSLGATVTVPLYLAIATAYFEAGDVGDPSMPGVVVRVLAVTVLPVALGMTVRRLHPAWVDRRAVLIRRVSLVAFVAVVAGAIVAESQTVREHLLEIAGAAVALNLAAMGVAYGASKAARLTPPQATSISLELGVHNSALAIAVAASVSEEVAVPAAVYSTFMVVTGAVFARAMARRNARAGGTAAHT